MAIDVTVDRWIEQARSEAALMGSEVAGSEHLLLGLFSGDERASMLLSSVGMKLDAARELSAVDRELEPGLGRHQVAIGGLVTDLVERAGKFAHSLKQQARDVHILHVIINSDQQCLSLLRNLHVDMRKLEDRVTTALQLLSNLKADVPSEESKKESSVSSDERIDSSIARTGFAASTEQGMARWFAPDSLLVLQIAQDEADKLQLPINVENILIGLERAKTSDASKVCCFVDIQVLKDVARELDFRGQKGALGTDVFSPLAMQVLKAAWAEARRMNKDQLSSIHILLGVDYCLHDHVLDKTPVMEPSHGTWVLGLIDLRERLLNAYRQVQETNEPVVTEVSTPPRKDVEVRLRIEILNLLDTALDETIRAGCPEVEIEHVIQALILNHHFDKWIDFPQRGEEKPVGGSGSELELRPVPTNVELGTQVLSCLMTAHAAAERKGRNAVCIEDLVLSILYSNNQKIMACLNQHRIDVQSAVYSLLARDHQPKQFDESETFSLADFDFSFGRR